MNNAFCITSKSLDTFLFVILILGFIATHSLLSYSLIFIAYFALTLRILLIKNKLFVEKSYLFLFILFLLNIIIQVLFNISLRSIIYSLLIIIGFILYSSIASFNLKHNSITKFALFLLFILLLHPSILDSSLQYKSFLLNANSLASVYLLLFFIIELFGTKPQKLLNYFIFLPIYLISIESRSLLLAIILYLFFKNLNFFKLRNLSFNIVIIFLIILMLFFVYPNNLFISKIMYSLDLSNIKIFGSDLFYGAGREELWKIVIETNPSPIYGIGFGNSNDYINNFIHKDLSPHNTFLKLYLEGGLLFLSTYILLVFFLFRNAKTNITKSFILAIQIRMFFESAFPFGVSLSSALIILPYFIEKAYLLKYSIKNYEKNYISHTC